MSPFLTELVSWLVLPVLVAVGAASLVWVLMQARIRVLTAHYQAAIAKVECECGARRPALEELLSELRMERRRFVRRLPGAKGSEITLITQERMYLRNVPLTGWMQDELPLGNGEELATTEACPVPLITPAPVPGLGG